jgi:dihydroorotate dehydrogenase
LVIIKKPWLLLSAKLAHDLSQPALKLYGFFKSPKPFCWKSFQWRHLHFENPLGTSGGVDKNAETTSAFWALGAGFLEVGTVTPRPQNPNPGNILDRDFSLQAVWNKMGFPNKGVANMKSNLKKISRPYPTPLFINIGKNRDTKNDDAVQDYLFCIKELWPFADAFVVNISSPNTSGLRDLLQPPNLSKLLAPLISECKSHNLPILLKLSPDMSESDLKSALDISSDLGIDGWILTNTTLQRAAGVHFPPEGGVSGAPLSELSKTILKSAVRHLGDKRNQKLLISVGGILTPKDILERLELGAHLVQVYSALIFEGPTFFKKVAQDQQARCV